MLKPELFRFRYKISFLSLGRWQNRATGHLADPERVLHGGGHTGYHWMHQAESVRAVEKDCETFYL